MLTERRAGAQHLFNLALFCFFLAAIFTIWLFLGVRNWIELEPSKIKNISGEMVPSYAIVDEPGADPSKVWNPFVVRTDSGRYYVQCENPYDQSQGEHYEDIGFWVALAATGIFLLCFAVFSVTRRYVERMYLTSSLDKLGERQ